VELSQGTSLCKLGFPFHEFKAQFDSASSQFIISDPVTFVRYPLDGILTRYINFEAPDKSRTAKFVEMSSPGLRGQSGGPWFDVNGVVWGLQSRTQHLALGFSPQVEVNAKKVRRAPISKCRCCRIRFRDCALLESPRNCLYTSVTRSGLGKLFDYFCGFTGKCLFLRCSGTRLVCSASMRSVASFNAS
jgi:hypothetical protein